MFSSLSLRTRMFAVAVLGAIGTIIVGSVGYAGLNRSLSATEELSTAAVMQREQMQADMMHDAIRSDVYSALLASTTADSVRAREAATDLAEHVTEFEGAIASVAASSKSSKLNAQLVTLKPALEAYARDANKLVKDVVDGAFSTRAEITAFEAQFKRLEEEMGAFGDIIGTEALDASASASTLFERAKLLMVVISIVIIAFSLLASMFTQRHITSGLARISERTTALGQNCITDLRNAMTAMTHGDLTLPVVKKTALMDVTSRDELGALTETLNTMISMAHTMVDAFANGRASVQRLVDETHKLAVSAQAGALNQRADSSSFEGSFRDVIQGVNQTLDAIVEPINEATIALERLAERDLTARVTGDFNGDHAKIQRAFNSAMDNLSSTMSAVSDTADGVAASAHQIDAGSHALARSASDQAASLEEVSASAREMSAMTKRNADSAAEGRSLAEGAQQSTAEGVTEAKRLAEAIGRIKTSSEATARIVKTIDEIAFQTNLLALNAAVEAARAGDSGRGFAVVAEEVRSLALRSAEAARSTATLIEESVQSTEQGVAINNRMLSQLADIDSRVGRVGHVVREIAAASEEQAKGVQLIDGALEEMARRTQAVAANADESKSASDALTTQSGAMRELVSGFELGAVSRPPRRAEPVSRVSVGRGRPARQAPASSDHAPFADFGGQELTATLDDADWDAMRIS
jgi:methyl-accepting chemotaxis protein